MFLDVDYMFLCIISLHHYTYYQLLKPKQKKAPHAQIFKQL